MRYVSILFLCLVFTISSFATTYYVSLSGNDSNDGSSGRPWRTIANAVTKIPAGQGHTLQISAGTFVENQIHVPVGVHLSGAGRDATIIKSNPSFYYYPSSPGFTNDKFLIRFYSGGSTAGNQSIKNLTIDGDGKKLHGGIFICNRNNVTVDNIKVQYVNFSGLWFYSSHNGVAKNIVLKDCAWGSSSWCSAALQFGNSTNLDISNFDIDEGRGYGIKNLGHDQNTVLRDIKLHHGKVSVHQVGLWDGGSAPNISIELWASGFDGTEIYNTYVDNHMSFVNPRNTQSATPLKIYNNVFDILGPRTNGSGYCMELSSSSVEIKNNWFYGGYTAVVNWAGNVYSNWNIHHNVFYGISGGVNPTAVITSYKGGVQNLNLYNNTVEMTSTSQAVHFVEFDNSSRGTNVNVKNNLFVSATTNNKVVNLRGGGSVSNLNVTNNFFQNISQGTAPGNYSANTTGTANILRSGNKPQTFYNPTSGGNLIDKGTYVGFEGSPDIGACGDNNVIGTAGTSSSTPTSPSPVAVSGVAISPNTLTLGINATSTLNKTISPSNATNQGVTWSSSNANIAKVDASSGLVTGVAAGTATVTVKTNDGAKTASATVTVTASTAPAGGNGVLTRAVWNGISGGDLSQLKSNGNFPNSPSTTGTISSFSTPSNAGDNYGTRVYGYIRPQTSGTYTFWIAGDDFCELYLSTDQNAGNKSLIASVPGWTNAGELGKYPQQKSVTKNLTAGQYYYVEALHKEGGGGDFISVYWQGPGISQSIIGSAYISTTASGTSTPVPVSSVSVSPATLTLGVNSSGSLSKVISPSNATNQAVTWSSSNAAIARVDASSGVVTGVAAGTATITVRTSDGNRTGTATVTVSASAPASPVAVNGVLTRAVWTGISGDFLTGLKANSNYPNSPNSTSTVSTFAGPTNWADNYGSKIYGYIRPQTTGSYTFWIAGDNNCELYLSTDQNSANKTMIASVPGYSMPGELGKYAQQKSVVKNLTAGQYYYVEALHKDGLGGEHVAVYWQGPGISQSIIGSAYISTSPGGGGGGGSPTEIMNALPEEGKDDQFVVYPVPIDNGQDFTVEVPENSSEIRMIDLSGRQQRSVPVNNERRVSVSSQGLNSGIYYLQVLHSRGSAFKKVMVK